MNDLTLLTVNWNQRAAMELMLRSFAKHHPGQQQSIIVDNGSTDDSCEWLTKNRIPFLGLSKNVGHERAINFVYNRITTRFALLIDTDVEILANLEDYKSLISGSCVCVGDLIEGNRIHDSLIMPRISPWFFLFDIQLMKQMGVTAFRGDGCDNWTYDVGSWYWEKIKQLGFAHHQLDSEDSSLGQAYDKFFHYTQISCGDPQNSEVYMRREEIQKRLPSYGKDRLNFVGLSESWPDDFVNATIARGWNPI
jgi:glycosyltransferase involved in cell wall biosynthesis